MSDETATDDRRVKVALVIGAGSVKCAAALGARRALEEAGIDIDLVVGCSGGTVFAAFLATGASVEEATEKTLTLWTRETMGRKNRRALLQAISPKLMKFRPEWGLRDASVFERNAVITHGDARIEDTAIPLFFTATDFNTGELVVLREGLIADGIRASSAIPFIFPPVRVGDRLLADGLLSDPLPVGVAMQEGADIIIALGFESPYQSRISSAGRFARQVSAIMANNLLKSRYAFHALAHHSEVIPIVPEFTQRIGIFSTDKIPHAIEVGEEATRRVLPQILQAIEIAGAGGG